jgi:cytochrome b561
MTQATDRTRYSNVAIALHWLIGLAIIGNLAGGLTHESVPKDMQGVVMGLHKATGITILVLSLFRLFWRLTHRPPPYEPTLATWEKTTAKVTHWAFYVLIIAIPFSGWLMTSAGGRKYGLNWYGLFDIPFLPVAQDKMLAEAAGGAHENLAFLLIALLLLHIGAAMKHVFLDGDGTFARMLPGRS